MRRSVSFTEKNHFLVLLLFMLILFAASPAGAAELLPFPSRDRAQQYQQAVPRPLSPQSDQEIESFRRDIASFPCPELDALYRKIRSQFDTAQTAADRDYYNRFLSELYREKSGRCNQ